MNCLDYRRSLLAEGRESDDMKMHRMRCPGCAESFFEHESFEKELRAGLDVPVPPGFEQQLAHGHAARRRRFLAAAGISALAAGIGAYAWLGREDPLALACIQFVMKEEASSIMMGAMPRPEAVPQGKVTLLIMPDATLKVGRRAVHDGLYARVVGLRKGSVGIVGSDPDVVDSVAGALRT